MMSAVSEQVQSSMNIMYRTDFSPPKKRANLPNPGSNHGLPSFTGGLTASKRTSPRGGLSSTRQVPILNDSHAQNMRKHWQALEISLVELVDLRILFPRILVSLYYSDPLTQGASHLSGRKADFSPNELSNQGLIHWFVQRFLQS